VKGDILITGWIKKDGVLKKGYIAADSKSGLIIDFSHGECQGSFEGMQYNYGDEYIIEAGDFNAHSHPEQSLYTDIVDKSWDLPTWCRNTIYKYSTVLTAEHVYLACCRAFSRMLMLGVTSVMVSFYCHNNRVNEFDKEVIRAARDTGIRLYFGRMNYDIINKDAYEGKKNSQRGYFETPDEAEENFIRLFDEEDEGTIAAAPAIHSIHASTKDAIVRAINLGNKYNRYVQFHLSEDKGDVELSLKLYGKRPVEFLSELLKNGEVKSLDNVVLSDCVWIDDNERRLIREHGMKVVLNPRMNSRIKTGEADLPAFLKEGITPYLGTDGEASNDDLSIIGERGFLCERFKEIPLEKICSLGKQPFKFKDGYIGSIDKGCFCDIKITREGKVYDSFVGGLKVLSKETLTKLDIYRDIEQPLRKLVEEI